MRSIRSQGAVPFRLNRQRLGSWESRLEATGHLGKIRHSGLMIKKTTTPKLHAWFFFHAKWICICIVEKSPPQKNGSFNDPCQKNREFWKETFAIKVFWKYLPKKLTNSLSLKPLLVRDYVSFRGSICLRIYLLGWIFAARLYWKVRKPMKFTKYHTISQYTVKLHTLPTFQVIPS